MGKSVTEFEGEWLDGLGSDPMLVMQRQRKTKPPLPGLYHVAVTAAPYLELGDGRKFPPRVSIDPDLHALTEVEVADGRRTHLKITISDEAIKQLEAQPDHGEDCPEMRAAFQPRPAQVEVVSDLPLLPEKGGD